MSLPNPEKSHFHYVGVAGSGMSALAQFQVMRGGRATGSDRHFDRHQDDPVFEKLKSLGVECFPQDGSGPAKLPNALIVSTAIEKDNPDLQKAEMAEIPVFHRSTLLAYWATQLKTIAVAGALAGN